MKEKNFSDNFELPKNVDECLEIFKGILIGDYNHYEKINLSLLLTKILRRNKDTDICYEDDISMFAICAMCFINLKCPTDIDRIYDLMLENFHIYEEEKQKNGNEKEDIANACDKCANALMEQYIEEQNKDKNEP